MTMSDRIAVFNAGTIEQLGSPEEIYERPRTAFVADFIGSANVLSARLESASEGRMRLKLEEEVPLELPLAGPAPVPVGEQIQLSIRPERVRVRYEEDGEPSEGLRLKAVLVDKVFVGHASQIFLLPFKKPGKVLLAVSMDSSHREKRASGATVWAEILPRDIRLLEPGAAEKPGPA